MHSEHILPDTLTRLHHVRDHQIYMREAHTTLQHTTAWQRLANPIRHHKGEILSSNLYYVLA